MADIELTIIDPPPAARYDLEVSKSWVRELEALEEKGFDVDMFLPQAKKDLVRLEKFRAKKSPVSSGA